jgi:hypothetical protein
MKGGCKEKLRSGRRVSVSAMAVDTKANPRRPRSAETRPKKCPLAVVRRRLGGINCMIIALLSIKKTSRGSPINQRNASGVE